MGDYEFQMQSALDGNYINLVLRVPCKQDKIAVRVIKENCPKFLLPFGITEINDEVTLKYKVPNAVSLKYMGGSFTKQMFLDFYEGILEPFMRGYDWFLDYHYICLVPDYIYVDKQTIRSSFLYIPEQSYRNTDEEIINFLKNALNKVMVTDDNAFLVQLYQYFNSGTVVISDLDHMIKAEKNKAALQLEAQSAAVKEVPRQTPQPAVNMDSRSAIQTQEPPSGAAADLQKSTPQSKASESSDNDMMNALFGTPPKKKEKPQKEKKQHNKPNKQDKTDKGLFGGSLFGKKKAKSAVEAVQPMNQTPRQAVLPISQMQPANTDAFHTSASSPVAPVFPLQAEESSITMISSVPYQTEKHLDLIESQKAGAIAQISLDFPNDFITIGRESTDAIQPDIRFDKSFMQISRMHLRIERRGDCYYAIDLGSGNHTLIDGQMMVPNTPYQLNAGAVLSIAANMPVKYRVNI